MVDKEKIKQTEENIKKYNLGHSIFVFISIPNFQLNPYFNSSNYDDLHFYRLNDDDLLERVEYKLITEDYIRGHILDSMKQIIKVLKLLNVEQFWRSKKHLYG